MVFPASKKPGICARLRSHNWGLTPFRIKQSSSLKLASVKFHSSRPIPDGATIKQARVVRRVSGWYVMLTLQWDVSVPDLMPHGEGIGIDVGLTNFIATSNGLLVKRQKFFIDAERKRKHCCNKVSVGKK